MKKLISLILAMLMLALPVFGTAEVAADAAEQEYVEYGAELSFFEKYLAEGQREVATCAVIPLDGLKALIPDEQTQQIVIDLLNAMKFQVSAQSTDSAAQSAFRILLNDENALDLVFGVSESGILISSNLIGNKTVLATRDEISALLQNSVPEDQQEAVTGMLNGLQDPQGLMAALIGEPDATALMAALSKAVDLDNMVPEEVTEAPEGFPEAAYVVTIPVSREALIEVAEEAAKLVWTFPVVQQIAPSATVGDGTPLTEESLTAELKKLPEALAEDPTVKVYLDAAMASMMLTVEAKTAADGQEGTMDFGLKMETMEESVRVSLDSFVTQNGETVRMTGTVDVTPSETGYAMKGEIAESVTNTEGSTDVLSATFDGAASAAETVKEQSVNALIRVTAEAGAEPTGVTIASSSKEEDLGDHAEKNTSVTVGLENVGDLVTIVSERKTDMAEAWLTAEGAAQVLSMSEEEQNAFLQEVTTDLQIALMTIITKLPESVQPLVLQMMGGGAQ